MKHKLSEITLFTCTLLSGFYAGTGFFTAMGGNPAIELMSPACFAEYWQHIDHFMAARMKLFGPVLLLSVFLAAIILFKKQRISFFFMLMALIILVADIFFTVSNNMPLNQLIQSWDLNNLPANVNEVKWKLVQAFDRRLLMMIACFVMVLLAIWTRKKNNNIINPNS